MGGLFSDFEVLHTGGTAAGGDPDDPKEARNLR